MYTYSYIFTLFINQFIYVRSLIKSLDFASQSFLLFKKRSKKDFEFILQGSAGT